ncbi:hypothetical protein THAOC_02868 [Thalassiosira oceanica]|uniref:MYND-type domain-containing protein n=1 Tax=Thalassiosira oceanica TaxID=159749 RepID=K0TQ45_THAOC|nr:hypothetical protein THAOC_02868 [Thalassiosira oceanica]|eukprot:EJK75407.1 hypothetical protein THAOC_02868 [Thalassiosira oceanica]
MSGISIEDCCANCGKELRDSSKLENCTAGRPFKYCSVDCQNVHLEQHKTACEKRAAELHDERLYSLGHERPEEDFCPICTLPIPLPMARHSGARSCCIKLVCHGCTCAASARGMLNCPFCRASVDGDEHAMLAQKRVDAKDPAAVEWLARRYFFGEVWLEKDASRAVELWTEAAELGSIEAHYNLGNRYWNGEGVSQDRVKAVRHLEVAAMKGNMAARCNLGDSERLYGNYERAVLHYLIAAKQGDTSALENIRDIFMGGVATKEQYAEALKGYQASVEEMKSPDRDWANKICDIAYQEIEDRRRRERLQI